jgi:PhnB protein
MEDPMSKVKPVPDGYRNATPYMIVDGAARALDFYKRVFGASERMRIPGAGGKIGHAEFTVGDSIIMLADEHPEMGARGPRKLAARPSASCCTFPTSTRR